MCKYILIAGVNGAGKSTLFHILNGLDDMPRVNTDEIVKQFGNWNNPIDVFRAGKQASIAINDCFNRRVTFNQETTLCGNSILKNIRTAYSLGYYIELHYVGVDSVDIAKERVKHRVSVGGHGIPEKDIERRYIETFTNLNSIISYCHNITFYDNTEKFIRFANLENGILNIFVENLPIWFDKVDLTNLK